MKIQPNQIKKIHIAIKEVGITDDQYREMLSGFITEKGKSAVSCKDLNKKQADILLESFKKLGFKPKQIIKNPFEKYDNRDFKFATADQLLKVYSLWQKRSKEKTEASLNKFGKRIVKKDHLSFWLKEDIKKLVRAIMNLKEQ